MRESGHLAPQSCSSNSLGGGEARAGEQDLTLGSWPPPPALCFSILSSSSLPSLLPRPLTFMLTFPAAEDTVTERSAVALTRKG